MRKRLTRKSAGLLCSGALVVGLASLYSARGSDGMTIAVVQRASASVPVSGSRTPSTMEGRRVPAAAPAEAPTQVHVADRVSLQAPPAADLFAPNNWTPAPPPPLKALPPPPPPPPRAPELPFRFVGLLEENDHPTAFLSAGDKLLLVKAGDTLEQVYRVDSVTAKEITLTYLPLKEQQTILVAGNP